MFQDGYELAHDSDGEMTALVAAAFNRIVEGSFAIAC